MLADLVSVHSAKWRRSIGQRRLSKHIQVRVGGFSSPLATSASGTTVFANHALWMLYCYQKSSNIPFLVSDHDNKYQGRLSSSGITARSCLTVDQNRSSIAHCRLSFFANTFDRPWKRQMPATFFFSLSSLSGLSIHNFPTMWHAATLPARITLPARRSGRMSRAAFRISHPRSYGSMIGVTYNPVDDPDCCEWHFLSPACSKTSPSHETFARKHLIHPSTLSFNGRISMVFPFPSFFVARSHFLPVVEK